MPLTDEKPLSPKEITGSGLGMLAPGRQLVMVLSKSAVLFVLGRKFLKLNVEPCEERLLNVSDFQNFRASTLKT